jgi:hypothetical protein
MKEKECIEKIKHKKILLDDKGTKSKSKMYFFNPNENEVQKIQIDGCFDDFEGSRCDWLIVDNQDIGYFVELKGVAISKACEQLENSIKNVEIDKMTTKYAFVIGTKVAPALRTIIQNQKDKFRKKGIKLEIKNSGYEFTF